MFYSSSCIIHLILCLWVLIMFYYMEVIFIILASVTFPLLNSITWYHFVLKHLILFLFFSFIENWNNEKVSISFPTTAYLSIPVTVQSASCAMTRLLTSPSKPNSSTHTLGCISFCPASCPTNLFHWSICISPLLIPLYPLPLP